MPRILIHEDTELFRTAVTYTAATTGFQSRLIEKDYFCSVVLQYLFSEGDSLVFKGGTCLAKVLVDFYRLSEDLDFVIPMDVGSTRAERSREAKPLKQAIDNLPQQLPVFRLQAALTGANNSTQYQAAVEYTSLISGQPDIIKIEIGLREPLLMPRLEGGARTLLMNPASGNPLVEPFQLSSISKDEAFAEKFRAALSRRDVAIRDFYDLDHGVRKEVITPGDKQLIDLVRQKLLVPGNDAADTSATRLTELRNQLDAQLRPVLREDDFNDFDLDRAFRIIIDMESRVS